MASEFTLGLVDKRGQLSAFAAEKEGSWSGPVPVGAAGRIDDQSQNIAIDRLLASEILREVLAVTD